MIPALLRAGDWHWGWNAKQSDSHARKPVSAWSVEASEEIRELRLVLRTYRHSFGVCSSNCIINSCCLSGRHHEVHTYTQCLLKPSVKWELDCRCVHHLVTPTVAHSIKQWVCSSHWTLSIWPLESDSKSFWFSPLENVSGFCEICRSTKLRWSQMWCQGLRLTQQSGDKRALHQMFKLDLEKAKEPDQRSNCQHPLDHRKSKRLPEKHLLHWLCESLWLCWSQQTVENS